MNSRHQALIDRGCTCFQCPPCSFCTDLDENEAEIYTAYGLQALAAYWDYWDNKKEEAHPMNRFFHNVLIIDANRIGLDRPYVSLSIIAAVDLYLIEHDDGYDIQKNRFGYDGYRLPKEKLPLFLVDPTKDYRNEPAPRA